MQSDFGLFLIELHAERFNPKAADMLLITPKTIRIKAKDVINFYIFAGYISAN